MKGRVIASDGDDEAKPGVLLMQPLRFADCPHVLYGEDIHLRQGGSTCNARRNGRLQCFKKLFSGQIWCLTAEFRKCSTGRGMRAPV